MLLHIILGLLLVGFGFVIVWKSEWIYENFGANAWAESKLGTSGGSRLLYKGIGLIFILVGLLYMTGMLGSFFISIFGWLFMIK